MVIRRQHQRAERGFLLIEAAMAMALLLIAVLPILAGRRADAQLFRVTYERVAAMEIVDGEAEILAAGAGRNLPEGANALAVHAQAAQNLPNGRFQVIRHGNRLRVEWTPAEKSGVGQIAREVTIP
jgi:hypothetical protein